MVIYATAAFSFLCTLCSPRVGSSRIPWGRPRATDASWGKSGAPRGILEHNLGAGFGPIMGLWKGSTHGLTFASKYEKIVSKVEPDHAVWSA